MDISGVATVEELQLELEAAESQLNKCYQQKAILSDVVLKELIAKYNELKKLEKNNLSTVSKLTTREFKISAGLDKEIIILEEQLKELKDKRKLLLNPIDIERNRVRGCNNTIRDNLTDLEVQMQEYCGSKSLDYLICLQVDENSNVLVEIDYAKEFPDFWFENKYMVWKDWKQYLTAKGINIVFDKSHIDDNKFVYGQAAKDALGKCKLTISKELLELLNELN